MLQRTFFPIRFYVNTVQKSSVLQLIPLHTLFPTAGQLCHTIGLSTWHHLTPLDMGQSLAYISRDIG